MINMNDENTCLTLEELQKSYDWVKVDVKLAMHWLMTNQEQFIYFVQYAPNFAHTPIKCRMSAKKSQIAPGLRIAFEYQIQGEWCIKMDFLSSDLYYVPSGNFGEHEV